MASRWAGSSDACSCSARRASARLFAEVRMARTRGPATRSLSGACFQAYSNAIRVSPLGSCSRVARRSRSRRQAGATRDIGAVDAAMKAFLDIYTSWLDRAARHARGY